jgi:alpha-N-arabinofuranosidase
VYWQTEQAVKNNWEKYEINGIRTDGAVNAGFEIMLEAEGSVWLDQCSLMPDDAVDGIWKNVFRAVRELHPTVLRFPGGCFADCYDWEEGIGPRDARPARVNRHWGGMEENNFGTDEFLKLCSNLGCEPMICINFGSADATEAAGWVEYCNGDINTAMGKRRAENGHPEPYHVKLWGIGNETWAEWEIGNRTAEQYAAAYGAFAAAMRAASPESIQLIACGGDGNCESQEWNRKVLEEVGQDADYLDLHFYAPQLYETPADERQIYEATVYASHKYEKILSETEKIIGEAKVRTRIMAGEYNAMYYNDSNREHTLETALLNAGFLNVFLRKAGIVRIGIYSDLVNGWQGGCIRSSQGEVYMTPSYYVLQLYAKMNLRHSLETVLDCERISIRGVGHVGPLEDLPVVDSAAAVCEDGRICLFLVNRHFKECVTLEVESGGCRIGAIQVIEGEHPYSLNDCRGERVCIREKTPESPDTIVLQPHSVCMAVLMK